MNLKSHTVLASLILLLILAALAGPAVALQPTTSDLLLPYFEVDLEGGGATTYFSVVNASDKAAEVEVRVHTNWGIEFLSSTIELKGGEVRTIDLSRWLVDGRLPQGQLETGELEHCKAVASGRRSPKTELYYSSEVEIGRAVGYVTIHTAEPVLFGDFFQVDAAQDAAQGEVLIDLASNAAPGGGLCERHGLRFLNGGGFDDTRVVIWTGSNPQPPSPFPYVADESKLAARLEAFRQTGEPLEARPFGLLPLEVVRLSELGLESRFGWLRLETGSEAHVSVSYSARERFSVGLQTFCLPAPATNSSSISIESRINGHDADTGLGPIIPAGEFVLRTFIITNDGVVALENITVSDDELGTISCPASSLEPGESMTCSVNTVALEGVRKSVAVAVATAADLSEVRGEDPVRYFGEVRFCVGSDSRHCRPAISIETRTNGVDADHPGGLRVQAGSPLTWIYQVTNTGNVDLENVTVTDDRGVVLNCEADSLAPMQQMLCSATGTAEKGQHGHLGRVTATGTDIEFSTVEVRDEDPSYYFGE